MIYWELLLGFLQVGLFSFGGAYGAIPLIREVVTSYGWLSDEALTHMIAVSESTPGPIMVNMATYVGSTQAGIPGAIIATTAVVLPAFCIILLVTAAMQSVMKHPKVQAVMSGLTPCIIGIILFTGGEMAIGQIADLRDLLVMTALALILFGSTRLRKKKLSPIMLILIAAVMGGVVYSL